jgi:hypothetical protein
MSCLVPSKSTHLISLSLYEENLIKKIFEHKQSMERILDAAKMVDSSDRLIAFLFSFYQVRFFYIMLM